MNGLGFAHRYVPVEGASKTVLVLHGTGGDENSLLPLAQSIAPNANLLSVRGNVLENGMRRFFRRFAEGVFDEDDIRRQAGDLAEFLRGTALEYKFDAGQVYALGYSNGANIASSLLLLHPRVLAGGVLLRAMVPLVPTPIPDLTGKRVLIASGKFDAMSPADETDRLAALLTSAGADVQVSWAEAGHELTRTDLETAAKWLAEVPRSPVSPG
jgi:phospholipase/carboxylesterase